MRRVVCPTLRSIEAVLEAGTSGCAIPANRLARAADGRAVRHQHNMAIAPMIAIEPRMIVKFIGPFLWSSSQSERVDDLADPDGARHHEARADYDSYKHARMLQR